MNTAQESQWHGASGTVEFSIRVCFEAEGSGGGNEMGKRKVVMYLTIQIWSLSQNHLKQCFYSKWQSFIRAILILRVSTTLNLTRLFIIHHFEDFERYVDGRRG